MGRSSGTNGRNLRIRRPVHAEPAPTMLRMQESGVHGTARIGPEEPADDWLGDISDYDWSEHAAERARLGGTTSREGLVAVIDDAGWAMPGPPAAAETRRETVERRRIVAGLVVAGVLGIAIAAGVVLLRSGSEPSAAAPATPTAPVTTTPATITPSTTPETPVQEAPDTTPTTTAPSPQETSPSGSATSFTLPEGTKLELGQGDPALVKQLQQALVAAGYEPGSVDGSFGPQTESAVTAFQQDNGLSADGVVGPETAAALNSAIAGA